jgi:CxxC motif-containing protein (DUF1111 family)
MPSVRVTVFLALAMLGAAIAGAVLGEQANPSVNSGGVLTGTVSGELAFSTPYANLSAGQINKFAKGHEQFNELWVLAPAPGIWGLGPTFNEANCAGCHPKNSRAKPAKDKAELSEGTLLKLAISGKSEFGPAVPHPNYGDQLQNRAAENRVPIEGRAIVEYEYSEFQYPDGKIVTLRKPNISFDGLNFGPIDDQTQLSMRIAPQTIGLGLLEAVPPEEILALAEAQNGTEVSGRVNYVIDLETEERVIGRFGWKATQSDLKHQTASAFHSDIGATSFFHPEKNCPAAQIGCLELPSAAKCGGQGGCTGNQFRPEVLPSRLNNIVTYLQVLNIPERRLDNPESIERGKKIFSEIACSSCHQPTLKTDSKMPIKDLRNMEFHPYTDLLLHDMGENLSDHRPDFLAQGNEWRTPPLWGIGLIKDITGALGLLHDGRAQSVEEAILWHGGEAEQTRNRFADLSESARSDLINFVNSL